MNEVFIDLFTDPTPISYEVVTGPIGAETDKARILRLLGPQGPFFVLAREKLLTDLGADCRNIDSYSYGSASFSRFIGTVTITLKDQNGNTIHDDLNPSLECKKSFGSTEFPESTSQLKGTNQNIVDLEKLKELWKDLQGQKPTTAEGLLNLETQLSSFNTDPFAQKKYN